VTHKKLLVAVVEARGIARIRSIQRGGTYEFFYRSVQQPLRFPIG